MIPHVVLCLAYQRERMAHQNSSLNSYIVLQWCSDTISEITSVVISLNVSLHHCMTIYMNSGTFTSKQQKLPLAIHYNSNTCVHITQKV